jgi:hypothetical protein
MASYSPMLCLTSYDIHFTLVTPLLSIQWINSCWWTDELSETCRVSCQNKFVKLVRLVGFITKKSVTMHGHMNVQLLGHIVCEILSSISLKTDAAFIFTTQSDRVFNHSCCIYISHRKPANPTCYLITFLNSLRRRPETAPHHILSNSLYIRSFDAILSKLLNAQINRVLKQW